MVEDIYNYWKNRRELTKKPLLRIFWKAAPDDKNPHVAFRPCVKDKMKLRKVHKMSDHETFNRMKELKQDLDIGKLLID